MRQAERGGSEPVAAPLGLEFDDTKGTARAARPRRILRSASISCGIDVNFRRFPEILAIFTVRSGYAARG
ncbi:hypothetical protein GCM10010156_59150 [Planobispora rosea]|nr:hypothetical protein GCM10010156_59150 [Planobispora rosea]